MEKLSSRELMRCTKYHAPVSFGQFDCSSRRLKYRLLLGKTIHPTLLYSGWKRYPEHLFRTILSQETRNDNKFWQDSTSVTELYTVPIESKAYLNSLARITSRKALKPQCTTLVWGKVDPFLARNTTLGYTRILGYRRILGYTHAVERNHDHYKQYQGWAALNLQSVCS